MHAVQDWQEDPLPPAGQSPSLSKPRLCRIPGGLEAAVWRADQIGAPVTAVLASGFPELDSELPGGGWPCRSLTELLQAQASVLEWRLLGTALSRAVGLGQTVALVGPPRHPHLPGLRHAGLDEHRLVWVQADTPAERLWCTEQLIKSNACGALVSWLPQARPEQIRRLQVCALACDGPVFLCRPAAAQHQPSAAPLRVMAGFGPDWELQVHILKRRGAAHEGVVRLRSVPGGLASVLTPRLVQPSRLLPVREVAANAVGSTAPVARFRRPATAH